MNLTYTLQHGRRWCSPCCGVACGSAPWLSAMLLSFPSFDFVLRRSSVCCRSSCEPERFSAMLITLPALALSCSTIGWEKHMAC